MKKSILVLFAALAPSLFVVVAEAPVSMPTVSVPTIGSGFYAPGSSEFYGPTSPSRPATPTRPTASAAKTTPRVTPSASAKINGVSAQDSASSKTSASTQKIADVQSAAQDLLTASDISSLGNLGYFRNLSGLLGHSRSQSQNASAVDLESVLSELNELKSRVDEKDRSPDVLKASFSNQNEAESKILRFSINNYDMNKTIKTVYFSKEESDGTFLLTGDRSYYADGATRAETFYLLFKTLSNEDGITRYKVTANVSQDYENPNSFLAKLSALSSQDDITADRTGNFVTMKVDGDDFKLNLLLGIER